MSAGTRIELLRALYSPAEDRTAKPQTKKRPGGNQGVKASKNANFGSKSTTRLPADWRTRIERMDVATYYQSCVDKLGKANAAGWAQGRCPFHEDRNDSLSVCLDGTRGGWRCFAGCGGGDLLGFHQRRTGLAFADAVRDLLRGAA